MTHPLEVLTASDVIYGRRSVRSYLPEPIDEPVIADLLAAAVQAPTAIHQEPWQFVIVRDVDRLRRLSDRAKTLFAPLVERLHAAHGGHSGNPFAQPDFNVFYGAQTLIIICAPSGLPFVEADCWMAAQNLMLYAFEAGLGSCVIGSAVEAINEPAFKEEFGIPATSRAIAPIIVGRIDGTWPVSPRKAPHVIAWR